MLVGLEVGRQVAAAALVAMSSIAPNPGVTTPTADDPPPATTSASPGAASGTGAAPSLAGSPCATAPATGSTGTTAPAATAATEQAATAAARYPAQVLPLDSWKLTLPTGGEGGPQEVEQPELATYSSEHFQLTDAGDGVVFRAGVGGVTTENSSYPRSELREMNGSERAAWSSTSGTHTMDVCQSITETPVAKPHVVSAQIHGGDDDVLQIRLEGRRLMVQYDDGGSAVDLDPAYQLGTPFHVRIVAAAGGVQVFYNGQQKAELPLTGSGWYWKAGAYVQSNTSKGDGPDAAGEVVIYALRIDHGDGSTGAGTGGDATAGTAPDAGSGGPGEDQSVGDGPDDGGPVDDASDDNSSDDDADADEDDADEDDADEDDADEDDADEDDADDVADDQADDDSDD